MRYLLAAIDTLVSSQKGKELKAILSEAREGADEKNAAQEFYETLERIVNELRGDTAHSTAFLQKVRKAEAPNYYDIIKRPMDLGTVLKKVKGQQYKDKRSFADDLDLIWSNCLEYNTLPEHPLRRAAMILKNKSHQLLQFVNDIHRPAGGTPARETPDAEGDTDDDFEPDETNATRKGMASRKRGAEASKSRARSEAAEGSQADGEAESERGRVSRSSSPASVRDRRGSTVPPARRKLTTRTDLVPFDERPALIRSREGMTRFMEAEGEPLEPVASTSLLTLDMPVPAPQIPLSPVAKPLPLAVQQLGGRARVPIPKSEPMSQTLSETPAPADPLKLWWEAAVGSDLIANGLPACQFVDAEPEALVAPAFESEESPLSLKIASNLAVLAQIRKRRRELLSIDEEAAEAPPTALALPVVAGLEGLQYAESGQAAQTAMQSVCTTLVAHVGFDAATGDALNVLTGLTISMLSNLGRTAQLLNDRLSQVLSPQEVLIGALRENGIDDPAELPAHVDESIDAYGQRLRDLLQKLANTEPLTQEALDALVPAEEPPPKRYEPPPPQVPLTEEAIDDQIGLLQHIFRARAVTEHGLHDDELDPVKPSKLFRPKVAASGRIPTKRRADKEPTAAGVPKKKKQKKSQSVPALAAAAASSPSKMETDEGDDLV